MSHAPPSSSSSRPAHGLSLAELIEAEEGRGLLACFAERALGEGALFDQADRDQILIVRRGRLRVYLATHERELSLAYLAPGDVFSTHTRAQIVAQEETTLLLAPRRAIERELAAYPPLQAAVIRVLARTLGQSITLIEDLAFHSVRGRIARYLLRGLARRGEACAVGAQIRLELTVEEIAALLGTARQTASSELSAMIREGAIARLGRGNLVVLDPAALRAWAGEPQSG
ncbi:Crp/Fnr family transcriptional regulator [Novosphingobium sp. 1949]|uniref:Crp/Fnr family transcriptional regulator n=1 Tax=Novosphingobium organovorum TaxID=2930092 RepID=A0ABT0BA37_9SPHN|nr:Crp/Fnr family transcriptional regulator [Novosphingobium organovorum]MCJ2181940.1 Crp/Fnr family transcriptional regulator [Novosphingobium organovorum]